MQYDVGDKVSLIYLNEEGIVIQRISEDMYKVAVGGEIVTINEAYLEPIYTLESAKNRIERLKRQMLRLEEELDLMFNVYDKLKKDEIKPLSEVIEDMKA